MLFTGLFLFERVSNIKKDIIEKIIKAAEVPIHLKEIDKLMRFKDKELYRSERKKKRGCIVNENK